MNLLEKNLGKHSNTKLHENSFSGSRVVPWGRTDILPVPAIFGRLTLDFRESKCFLRGTETQMKEQLQKFLVI